MWLFRNNFSVVTRGLIISRRDLQQWWMKSFLRAHRDNVISGPIAWHIYCVSVLFFVTSLVFSLFPFTFAKLRCWACLAILYKCSLTPCWTIIIITKNNIIYFNFNNNIVSSRAETCVRCKLICSSTTKK